MRDRRDEQLRIAAARADFLEYGPQGAAGVGDVVAASWSRSASAGLDADKYTVAFHDDIDFDSRLARCARPVLERLTGDMSDVPVTIALTDAQARIVDRRDCSTAVGRVLDRVDFDRGYSFEESTIGTNGVGTVFEVGAPVSVVGSEHFNQSLVQFACTGAPILDPLTGRVAGVLDASMLAESWNSLVDALVRSAATDISRNLLLDRSQDTRAVFETYLRASARPGRAVIALGETVMANEAARSLLNPDEQAIIGQYAEYLMSKHDNALHTVTLDSGRQIRMRTKHITSRGDVVGVVAVLDEDRFGHRGADETDSRIASLPTISAGGMRSPSWISAYNEVAHSLTRNTSVIVLGEPGSGRLSILTDAFRIESPAAPIVVIDAADPRQTTQTTSPPTPADGRGLLVLRHIDSLPAQVPQELRSVIDDAVATGYILAATSSSRPSTTATTYGGLVARFDHSVTLPPLRLRGPDLQLLVERILKSIAPQRNTRISPQAMRVISAYSWPQNLAQLHTALESALHRRPVGEIQPEDLPGFCRTTAHRVLTTLEIAERDAIVRVLGECGGNRARAAQVLGMSRSSIYRKIHTYGITGV
ncbi:sigma-54-dependent Fis family transcriptional regulator [Gordonia jacobaea]|uniref:sigma-54-dependent Fis family transcriptional regulator n=1 Tax=Gordonia jacobaea TaxID=122202 RepID=UPI003D73D912